MNNQYLIAANSKRGQLIFSIFRPFDLWLAIGGTAVTVILFLIFRPDTLWLTIIVLLPILICAFLVIPIPNYHNILCILQNVYRFYFAEEQEFKWKGWCCRDEFKD